MDSKNLIIELMHIFILKLIKIFFLLMFLFTAALEEKKRLKILELEAEIFKLRLDLDPVESQ
jgi:hypothetical protein